MSAVLGAVAVAAACAAAAPAVLEGPPDELAASSSQAAAPAKDADAAPKVDVPDPEAPATYRPVKRNGQEPKPTVTAAAGRFASASPVRFPDGVSISVDRVSRRVEDGEGAGIFPGRPQTAFTVTFKNASQQAVDLSQTVVTATYGVRPRIASPVYQHPEAADFAGVVAPGGSASATYVFAIPPGQAKTLVMRVDFDAQHAAATFTGLDEG